MFNYEILGSFFFFVTSTYEIQIRGTRCRMQQLSRRFLGTRLTKLGSAAGRSSIKSGIESKSRRDGSRDERNWPSSLPFAVDPCLGYQRPFAWPGQSLIFPQIYLIIARLTTSSFTSKGIECRQFPVSTLPFLRSAPP